MTSRPSGCNQHKPGRRGSFSRLPGAVLFLPFLALFTACEAPPAEQVVDGQIFIVAPEGQVFRLGLVEVQLFEEREVERYLDRTSREISEKRQAVTGKLKVARGDVERLRAERQDAEEALRSRNSEVREELAAYMEETDATVARWRAEIAANEELISQVDERPSAPAGIPSREEYEEFSQRRSRWFSMSAEEREAWAEAMARANRELSAKVESLEEDRDAQLVSWSMELDELEDRVQGLDEEIEVRMAEIEGLESDLEGVPSTQDYLEDLPPVYQEVRTDADGEFTAVLPSGNRYGVYARAQRYVAGESKEFQWLIWIDTSSSRSSKVLLSNHNLLMSGAEESILAPKVSPVQQQAGL